MRAGPAATTPGRAPGAQPAAGRGCLPACRRARIRRGVGAGVLSLLVAACTSVNPYHDAAVPHRGPEGFRNNYPTPREGGYWRWQWERWRDGHPRPPANGYRFPMAEPEVAFLRANRSVTAVTWVGHATVLLQVGGLNILTDPHFGPRASPFSFAGPRRFTPPGLTQEQLPRIDAVVLSHNHYDHLDAESVARLAAQPGGAPRFYVPLGMRKWFNAQGITSVTELDWWESRELAGVRIHCVPVQHWSQRTLIDRNQALWGGWVIEHGAQRFFFSGDTGYSQDFRDIARRFGAFDFAAIPIGAYEPRWFMAPFHVNPAEAVQIHLDLDARYSLGIHWGAFELTDEPLDEPPVVLQQELARRGVAAERFFVLRHGETWRMPASPAPPR